MKTVKAIAIVLILGLSMPMAAQMTQQEHVDLDAMEKIKDENIDVLRSLKDHPLVTVGAHPLGMLMCMVVVQAEARRLRAAAQQ